MFPTIPGVTAGAGLDVTSLALDVIAVLGLLIWVGVLLARVVSDVTHARNQHRSWTRR
ncbi:MAG: hypothetical protein Q8O61_08410 [Nocardioides sp.]|nr:hypothetical protein [Nocardioides sp.]